MARAGIVSAGRAGTIVITVWPHGQDAASGCQGLDGCTEMSVSDPDSCAQYESGLKKTCLGLVESEPLCGRVDAAVRPSLGLTHPGWELRCTVPGGRAVSILVTNQTGASADPLPQPELPLQLEQLIPIVTALVTQAQ